MRENRYIGERGYKVDTGERRKNREGKGERGYRGDRRERIEMRERI